MLLEMESSDVNKTLDKEQYNSSNTKLMMKKLTPNVKYISTIKICFFFLSKLYLNS